MDSCAIVIFKDIQGLLIMADPRDKVLQDYRKKLLEHKEIDGRLTELREQLKELTKQYEKSENDLKALQSVGQIVGEVLKQLTEEKFIVKATNGPRYVVGCRRQLDKSKLKPGTRVALDMTTLTIMRYLPREVDPLVYNMSHEDPGNVTYSEIGGLSEQIRELREDLHFYALLIPAPPPPQNVHAAADEVSSDGSQISGPRQGPRC
ncbi:26S protease regulatory subunit 10B [Microtus ochrogaster]|uniref:26S protease regulatory subunit 10B n=1 Tax=Microtus ochrogaster TaxID=79684 RepID=A0A8J6GQ11_MICOH|nr:26S protease regulatory subunit 10B [Microtus ochrogaster]